MFGKRTDNEKNKKGDLRVHKEVSTREGKVVGEKLTVQQYTGWYFADLPIHIDMYNVDKDGKRVYDRTYID